MKTVCVFCGSSKGTRPEYAQAASDLARLLVERDTTIVYGAGSIGLMGILADEALSMGGQVVGVIPEHLCSTEVMHDNLSEMHVTASLLERKLLMMELSEAFIALPGGLGTLDEILEVYTWGQLGRHDKPLGLLNTRGYFDPFINTLDHAVEEGFLQPHHRRRILVESEAFSLLERM